MDTTQLKQITSKAQIITVIEKASLFGGDIWQSDSGLGIAESRHLSQIIHINNELKSDKVIFRTPSNIQLRADHPIYVRLNYRNIIFILHPGEFRISGDKITCQYPQEARALEERQGGERYVLPFNSEMSLSLKRMERTIKEMTYEIELRIIDVSRRGFGILISGQNRDYLKKHDNFLINAIDHVPLSNPILGTVCYVAPKGYYLKRGDVRVGLSLRASLAKDTLEYFKKHCLAVLAS